MVEGFLGGLNQGQARVFIEHLDARRFPETTDRSQFIAFLTAKYHDLPIAVLVACDDAALDFWLEQRDALFPGRPIVFCGVNDFTPARIAGVADITGVGESPDVLGTLELALTLVPGARTVLAFGSDASVTGRANLERFRRAVLALERRVRPVEILNTGLEAAASAVACAPADAVVLRLSPLADVQGDAVALGHDAKALADVSPVPLFGLWDFDLGSGVVGGRVLRSDRQGAAAAAIVAEILAGRPATAIAVADVTAETVLDFNALEHFGLPLDRVPKGATIENAPASLYERHKGLFWAGAAALAASAPGVLVLAWMLAARRRTEAQLAESERRYRELVECANSLILRFDATGRLVFVNDYAERLLGYTRAEMLAGQAVFWPATPPDLSSLLARAMSSPESLAEGRSENQVTSKDGRRMYLHWDNRPLFDAAGKAEGWLAVGSDITARRLAEEALAARALAEEELAIFGRELLGDAPDAVDRALTRLLTAFSLGRAAWFANVEDERLGLCCRLSGEACVAGLSLRRGHPGLELVPYSLDGFQWADRLAAGEILAGPVEEFSEPLQDVMAVFGLTAVLAAPVTRCGVWIGFVTVGEVRAPRRFTRQEQALLSTAASLLSAHLSRER
jgi:PAS domain S-box-containing protein